MDTQKEIDTIVRTMYLRLKPSIEARPHIRIAYRESVGKTMYAK